MAAEGALTLTLVMPVYNEVQTLPEIIRRVMQLDVAKS